MNPCPCEICGELIPLPVARRDDRVICADCAGETRVLMCKTKRFFPSEAADIAYHGSRFNRGEW